MEVIISTRKGSQKEGPRVNKEIKASEVRLIVDRGEQVGVVSLEVALQHAYDAGLDLVEVSPNAKPPVVKLIDYGKYKYQAQKKLSDAKKKQVVINLKEIQFRPNIEKHDIEVKLNRAKKFIESGDKIKLIMQFRGREMSYKSLGMEKFQGLIDQILELGAIVESGPSSVGNKILCTVAPDKKTKK